MAGGKKCSASCRCGKHNKQSGGKVDWSKVGTAAIPLVQALVGGRATLKGSLKPKGRSVKTRANKASGSGLRPQGSGLRPQGSGLRPQGSGLRPQGSGRRLY